MLEHLLRRTGAVDRRFAGFWRPSNAFARFQWERYLTSVRRSSVVNTATLPLAACVSHAHAGVRAQHRCCCRESSTTHDRHIAGFSMRGVFLPSWDRQTDRRTTYRCILAICYTQPVAIINVALLSASDRREDLFLCDRTFPLRTLNQETIPKRSR